MSQQKRQTTQREKSLAKDESVIISEFIGREKRILIVNKNINNLSALVLIKLKYSLVF
jgi:hypothetical protein